MRPSLGRILHYVLSDTDAVHINRSRNRTDMPGGQVGNPAYQGDIVPLIVVRVWDGGLVNGQAILDGNDSLWVTSVHEGTASEPGTWMWPPRIEQAKESQ